MPAEALPPLDTGEGAQADSFTGENASPKTNAAQIAPVDAEAEAGTRAKAETPATDAAQDQAHEPDEPSEPDEPHDAPADETTGPDIAGHGAVDGVSEPAEREPQAPAVTAAQDERESAMAPPAGVPQSVPEEMPEDVEDISQAMPQETPEYPPEWVPVKPGVEDPRLSVAQTQAAPTEWPPTESSGGGASQVPVAAPAESSVTGLQVPWTLRQTLIGAGLTLIPWLIFAVGSQLLQRGMPQPAHPHRLPPTVDLIDAIVFFLLSSALEAVFLIAPLIYAMRTLPPEVSGGSRWRSALRALGLGLPQPVVAARAGVLAIAVILGASVAYSSIIQALHLPLKTNVDTLLQQAKYAPYTVIGTLLVAVLVAPFCEETFFRGFLFPGLARGMRLWGAVVLSAALFGLAHTDLGSFVVLFVIGIVLAVLRARTSSLWPGIAVHTLNNTIAFISILVLLHH